MALDLPYTPNRRNAVCCSSEGVVIASTSPPSLYLYTWSGRLRQTLTSDQLAVPASYWVQAVQCGPNERVLQLAVGKDAFSVCALRVYRVSDTNVLIVYKFCESRQANRIMSVVFRLDT